jgi:hypothetical protein
LISRDEDIKNKRRQIEECDKTIQENQESIIQIDYSNVRMERKFQICQEMKFYLQSKHVENEIKQADGSEEKPEQVEEEISI